MSMYEVGPGKPVMPSVGFIYGTSGKIVGETTPAMSPVVAAYIDGNITAEECFQLRGLEVEANESLRSFMHGNRAPDFMPKIPRTSRWRGWLKGIMD